jgi:hypothetical protein
MRRPEEAIYLQSLGTQTKKENTTLDQIASQRVPLPVGDDLGNYFS